MRIKTVIAMSFLISVVLTGCSSTGSWTKTQAKEWINKQQGFKAVLPEQWMRVSTSNIFIMTLDGVVLNEISVQKLKIKDSLKFTKKKFDHDMLPMDIAEIEIDNLKMSDYIQQLDLLENKPVTISGQDGFRLKFTYETTGGLKMKAEQFGFKYKDFVYRIMYAAPMQHYFDHNYKIFNDFIKSFELYE